jgi:putative ABC transport system permease protein
MFKKALAAESLTVKLIVFILFIFSYKDKDKLVTIQQTEHILKESKTVYGSFSTSFPFNYSFLNDKINQAYVKESQTLKLITWFLVFGIILFSLGMLSLALILINKRTKEIGIRKVNGAKITEILTLLNKDFVIWAVIAFILATPITYYSMSKWLENFAYKTTLSWWLFALAGLIALGIALLTVSWQTFRAARRNPVEALRYE